MTMRRCPRCGMQFEVYRADDRYDPVCAGQVAAIEARLTKTPEWLPTWRREPRASDRTPGPVR